jgi:hypothetical protein
MPLNLRKLLLYDLHPRLRHLIQRVQVHLIPHVVHEQICHQGDNPPMADFDNLTALIFKFRLSLIILRLILTTYQVISQLRNRGDNCHWISDTTA